MKERRHEADYEGRETGGDPLQGNVWGFGQDDTKGAVLFNDFLFKFFNFFQPATTSFQPPDPDAAGARALKSTL